MSFGRRNGFFGKMVDGFGNNFGKLGFELGIIDGLPGGRKSLESWGSGDATDAP